MADERQLKTHGFLLAGGGAMLFSLKGIVMKLAFDHGASVELMMALRMGFSLPFFLAIGVWSHRRSTRSVTGKTVVSAALLGALSYYVFTWLDFTGLKHISAQLERLILFLYPTFTALFAWIFLKDKTSWQHGLALVLSYLGVGILVLNEMGAQESSTGFGAILVLSAAILFAVYVVAAKPVISQLGSALFTSIAMSTAALCILMHFGVQAAAGAVPSVSPTHLLLGIVLAVPCTILPSFMTSEAIARIGPGLTSGVAGVGPVATALFAVAVLGEAFGWSHLAATVLTTGGLFLLSRSSRQT
ncbi:MAG: DMT family transporter [Pseudomonadota bacterium]